jgi:hypothetical protein
MLAITHEDSPPQAQGEKDKKTKTNKKKGQKKSRRDKEMKRKRGKDKTVRTCSNSNLDHHETRPTSTAKHDRAQTCWDQLTNKIRQRAPTPPKSPHLQSETFENQICNILFK